MIGISISRYSLKIVLRFEDWIGIKKKIPFLVFRIDFLKADSAVENGYNQPVRKNTLL